MSADQRAEFARTYLAAVSGTGVEQLPPSVLMRVCAELQRLLGQVPVVPPSGRRRRARSSRSVRCSRI